MKRGLTPIFNGWMVEKISTVLAGKGDMEKSFIRSNEDYGLMPKEGEVKKQVIGAVALILCLSVGNAFAASFADDGAVYDTWVSSYGGIQLDYEYGAVSSQDAPDDTWLTASVTYDLSTAAAGGLQVSDQVQWLAFTISYQAYLYNEETESLDENSSSTQNFDVYFFGTLLGSFEATGAASNAIITINNTALLDAFNAAGKSGDLMFKVTAGAAYDELYVSSIKMTGATVEEQNPTNPVPEPTTMLLFGAGLTGLAFVSRKKI